MSEESNVDIPYDCALKTESLPMDEMEVQCDEPPAKVPSAKRSSGFFIEDILGDTFTSTKNTSQSIVRPWDLPEPPCIRTATDGTRSKNAKESKRTKGSPLDALFKMASKTFEGLERADVRAGTASPHNNSATGSSNSSIKKKRKSRTAFTNHQVFELEKRFLYQKYLSPADRDDIAQTLHLSNAQVITWFQNRRAKLKRDQEELKKDVTATRLHAIQKSFFDVRDLAMFRAAKYLDVKRLN
ncbi:transcription factor LBX2-like [Paramacrobiotus metropolitanus]|uniref:transcription factor LBX2-like n=1 Tax=Paramacrobiotus metropolitanus TaxID=2943436 RepID=UPI0024459CD7|nr:transcription factor LBX2-like [Paramacrobiotus metropolitanus]